MFTKSYVITLILLFCNILSHSQTLPLDPAVKKGVLQNGFTYYLRKNAYPEKHVELYLVNKAGSILENDDQRGLAHFIEHMSFNGTKHFPKNTLIDYLQKAGVRFGADVNAYTGFDETVYQLPVPSGDPEVLKKGLLIMRDWAQYATLKTKEINKERGVILEEKRLGKGAQERMSRLTLPMLLNYSRYASRLPIGTDEVLNNFPRRLIVDFYNNWYRPDLQAIIVVGDIDVNEIEASIKSLFGDLKMPSAAKPRMKYEVSLTGQNQFIAVTDKEFPHTVVQVMIKQKSRKLITSSDYMHMIDRQLFNQMMAARLSELSRAAHPPFSESSVAITPFLGGLDALNFTMVAMPGQLENGFKAAWSELERAKKHGFTQSELERAKANYLNFLQSRLKEKDKTNSASLVKEYVRNFLEDEAAPGIEMEYKITSDYLAAITVENINAVAAFYIANTNRDIVLMSPEKENLQLPDEATVLKWIQSVKEKNLNKYTDSFQNTALSREFPVAGKIVAEKTISELGITELTFGNGAKVVLKPTAFRNNEIIFNVFSPGGTSCYEDADYHSAANAAGIVASSGLGEFTADGLSKLLSGKTVNIAPYIAEWSEGLSGYSSSTDFGTALQVMHKYFTQPRIDSAVFRNIIDRSSAAILNRKTVPKDIFDDTVTSVLGNYSYRKTAMTQTKLNQVNLGKIYKIYKERFANAGDFTFLFSGNFNVDSIKPLLALYIGSLPGDTLKEKPRNLKIRIPQGRLQKVVTKGMEKQCAVQLVISGRYEFSMVHNILLNAIGEILQYRLTERLREKEGGAYSPSVKTTYFKIPESNYLFTISFGCDPANAEKLVSSVEDEIKKMRRFGVTRDELFKFTRESKLQLEVQLQTNYFWVAYLSDRYEYAENPTIILSYNKELELLTPASVNAAAELYFNLNNFISFMLMPESIN